MKNGYLVAMLMAALTGVVTLALWFAVGDTRRDTTAEWAERRSRTRVELICAEVRQVLETTGDYPAMPTTADALLRPGVDRSRSDPLLDGWGHVPRLIVEDGQVVGAYSVGRDGVDSGGGGDDLGSKVLGSTDAPRAVG